MANEAVAPAVEPQKSAAMPAQRGLALLNAVQAKPKVTFRASSGAKDDVIIFEASKADYLAAITLSESGKTTGVTIAIVGEFDYVDDAGNIATATVQCMGARTTVKPLSRV